MKAWSGGRRSPPLAAVTPGITAAYLVVAALPLVAGGGSSARGEILVAHLLALFGCAALAVSRACAAWRDGGARGPSALDWLPVALVPFLYWELPYLNQVFAVGYRDATIVALEGAVFPGDFSRSWAGALDVPLVSEALHLAYLCFYPMIFGPPLLFYLTGRREPFERTLFGVMLAFTLCFTVFLAFPVQGPRFAGAAPPGIPEGPVRRLALFVLEAGSSRGTAFPSSHVAVAVVQSMVAVRLQPRIAPALWVTTFGLAAGAVYGGFHYAIDVVLGAAVGAGAAIVALRLGQGR